MKRAHIMLTVLFCTLTAVLISCKKEPGSTVKESGSDTLVQMTPYDLESFSPLLPKPYVPEDNKLYVERIQLGRMLYYDPILSNDGRACASCHEQSFGFTVPGMVNGMPVLPHVNLAWNTNYMWDGSKTGTVEDLMLFEVKEFFASDLAKINGHKQYRDLFKKYYNADSITYKELSYALAQFIRTLVSSNSKYDRYVRGIDSLTREEEAGMGIFFSERGDCFHCHTAHIMTDNIFHNNGLESSFDNPANKGLYNVTGNSADLGKFRTPNLRNVALRKKFMHDGRFSTLEEVVDFYSLRPKASSTLDPIMTKPNKKYGLELSPEERKALVAFLHTLTDSEFLTNPKLGKP